MTNWIKLSVIAFCAFLAVSCGVQEEQTSQDVVVDSHTSENALDWAGVYRGTLPCADCAGILTVITLNGDKTFTLATRYLDKELEAGEVESGAFSWSDDGRIVTLNMREPNRFQVGENVLFALDMEGNRIDGPLAEHYRLTKVPDVTSITEHYWKLVSLHGKKVRVPPTNREAHLILKDNDMRVQGAGGCNGLGGLYELSGENGVRFSEIMSTEMACAEGMDVEQAFLSTLLQVASFAIQGDVLVLYGAVTPESGAAHGDELARFEAVYLY